MPPKRLYQSVAEQITQMIDDGRYPPNARLPGERELAEQLGVSRVTVREAEIALQAVGRLEIKTGSGVYVTDRTAGNAAELPQATAFEVTEARLLIESDVAALAAHNVTPDEIALLDELIERMGSADEDSSNGADARFHLTIAEASRNAAMVHTVKTLWRMREELPEVKAAYESVCIHDTQSRIDEHRAVLDALKAGDPVAARSAMREHFERLMAALLEATEKQALEKLQQQASESRARFRATAKIG